MKPAALFPVTLSKPKSRLPVGWQIALLTPSSKTLCVVTTQKSLKLCQRKAAFLARAVNSYETLLSAVETLTKNQK